MSDSLLRELLTRPEVDRVFDALRDRQRRFVLLELWAGRAERVSDVLPGGTNARTATIELEHKHLPRLSEVGYVDWDRETGELWKGPAFDEVEPLLELLADHAEELPPEWPESRAAQ